MHPASETTLAELPSRLECETRLRRLTAGLTTAAQAGVPICELEGFAAAMRKPGVRGRAGGLARGALARRLNERWPDGRCMSHDDREEINREIADAE